MTYCELCGRQVRSIALHEPEICAAEQAAARSRKLERSAT